MDIVYVRDLKLDARIGIYEWEKRIRQKIRIDLEMGWNNQHPAATGRIEDCLNYMTASLRIQALVEQQHFALVETLAETIAHTLMHEFAIPWLRITVGKLGAVRNASEVGVRIERGSAN